MESNLYVRYVCSLTHDLIFYEISIWISCDNNFPTCGKFSSPLVARSAARPTVSVILPAATQLPYPSTLRSPIPMPHPTLVSCYRFLPLPPFSCSHSYTLSFSLSTVSYLSLSLLPQLSPSTALSFSLSLFSIFLFFFSFVCRFLILFFFLALTTYLSIHPSICLTLDLHQPTYRLWETLPSSLFLSFSEFLSLLTFLSISLPRRRALCESLVNLLAPL